MMTQSEAAYRAASGVSTADELSKLGELRAQGVINDQEYEDLKRRTWPRPKAGRNKRPRGIRSPARASIAEPRRRAASSRRGRCGKCSGPPQRGARPAFVGRRLVRARRPRSSACRERPGRRDRVPLFFWLLPLALILGGVLGFTSRVQPESGGLIRSHASAAEAVGEAVQATGRGRWALLLVGVGALLWTSSRSVIALRRVFALVWGVPPARGGNPLIEALAFSGICAVLLAIPERLPG